MVYSLNWHNIFFIEITPKILEVPNNVIVNLQFLYYITICRNSEH